MVPKTSYDYNHLEGVVVVGVISYHLPKQHLKQDYFHSIELINSKKTAINSIYLKDFVEGKIATVIGT